MKGDGSVTEIIHIHLCNKGKKKTHRVLFTGALDSTYMYHQVDWNLAHTLCDYVKLYGNQMSTKVVTCIS